MLLSQILSLCCEPLITKFSFYPDREDINYKLPESIQEKTITTTDGINIHSLYFPSPGSKKLVIYFHGNAGNIFHRIETLQSLCNLGVNVLGISYRGYGKSEGKVSEKGIYIDANSALHFGINSLNFQKENIYFFGRSIGSTAATHAAAFNDFAGLILVTPIYSAKEMAKVTGLKLIAPLAGKALDNGSKLKKVKMPTLIIHGTTDETVPYWMGKKLYEENRKNCKFITIKNGSHNELEHVNPDLYWNSIKDFLNNN